MSPGSGLGLLYLTALFMPPSFMHLSPSLSRLHILSLPDICYQIILYTVPGAGFIIHFLNLIRLNLLSPKREY